MRKRVDLDNLHAAAEKVRADWMKILLRELHTELSKRNIHDTGALMRSLQGRSGGGTDVLQYMLYGAFVDMGVGRGRTLNKLHEARQMQWVLAGRRGSRRGQRNHQWYSRRMGREVYILAKKMAELYADAGADALLAAMPGKIELLK